VKVAGIVKEQKMNAVEHGVIVAAGDAICNCDQAAIRNVQSRGNVVRGKDVDRNRPADV